MKKKSLITMLVALSLVAVVGIGATLAYLSDSTQTLDNTFTVGADIDISLVEHEGNVSGNEITTGKAFTDLQPGDVLYKDPTVTVSANSTACRVFMKVTGIDALEAIDTNGTVAGTDYSVTGFTANWVKVANPDKSIPADLNKKDGIYQYVGIKADANDIVIKAALNTVLEPLFTNVTYSTDALSTEGSTKEIKISACAIQADNLDVAQSLTEAIFSN